MRILALQSGTSADAIDAGIVEVRAHGDELDVGLIAYAETPWTAEERALLLPAVGGDPLSPQHWTRLTTLVGQAFARAAGNLIDTHGDVDVVCSHGQTVFHGVDGGRVWGTLQIGEPAWIAERTRRPVVFNLRVADVAAGGQGAPLMAVFDGLWLRAAAERAKAPVASLNLGGIANIQVVTEQGGVTAFDVGPANALIDAVVARGTDGAEAYDRDGSRAACGAVDADLLERLRRHPHFAADVPKSTGRETFALHTVDDALDGRTVSLDDLCATLAELTATTIADAVRRHARDAAVVVASGGGVRNPVLMTRLRALLPARVDTSDEWGLPAAARETVMFAVLAWLSAARVPLSLPGTPTGRAAVAGQWDLSAQAVPEIARATAPRVLRMRVDHGVRA